MTSDLAGMCGRGWAAGMRALLPAFADAAGMVLLADAALSLRAGHCPIWPVFFHVPGPAPPGAVVPAALGLGLLLRVRALALVALALAAYNAVEYFRLLSAGAVAGLPVCFSLLLVAAVLPLVRWSPGRGGPSLRPEERPARAGSPPAPVWAAAPAVLILLLAHVFTFGCTDYRRPAEAIVVFGAKAYTDGTPSEALADRTRTGIELYRLGYANRLVLSGGQGEPEAMKRLALAAGVPESVILLDDRGVNTAATVANLRGRFGRVLAVSHYYHNARIKLAARRAGLECLTVPARMQRRLRGEPYFVLRECAAFAAYYLGLV